MKNINGWWNGVTGVSTVPTAVKQVEGLSLNGFHHCCHRLSITTVLTRFTPWDTGISQCYIYSMDVHNLAIQLNVIITSQYGAVLQARVKNAGVSSIPCDVHWINSFIFYVVFLRLVDTILLYKWQSSETLMLIISLSG